MPNDRRIIGTGQDELIGRLLERTENLMDQNKSFEHTIGRFNETLDNFGRGVNELRGAVDRLSKAVDRQDGIEHRLANLEVEYAGLRVKVDFLDKVKNKVSLYLALLGAAAVLGGSGGGLVKDWIAGWFGH